MHRTFSKVAIVGAAFVVIVGLTIVMRGQEALRQSTGFPQDWSHSHLIFSNPGSFAQATRNGSFVNWYRIMNDPRFRMQNLRRNAAATQPQQSAAALQPSHVVNSKPMPLKPEPLKRDWNFSLQTASLATGVLYLRYPAKYSFNPIGAASCSSDYVIYVLNVAGSSSQANLIGVNNLYVGPAGTGCSAPSGSNGGSGSAPTPQVKWAFNVASTVISTSPVLSEDGTKVAYVVNSSPPVLHVLTLPSAQSGTITHPTSSFNSCNNATAPSLCTVTLSSTSGNADNISAPFVDYATDTGYVGDNTGHLYKITNFFSVNGTAPAIASGWPVTTTAGSIMGSPVYDPATGTVFVGSYDGNLYGFNATTPGTGITGSPLTLAASGSSCANSHGLWEAPIVDSTNHVLYAFYGCNSALTAAEVAQVVYYDHTAGKVEFVSGSAGTPGSTSTAVAGTNKADFLTTSVATYLIAEGAFSNGYYSSGPSSTSWLYACGTNALNTGSNAVGVTLQQFGFSSGRLQTPTIVDTINSTLTWSQIDADGEAQPCSPLTEFYNTSGTPTDYLFLSVPGQSSGNVLSYNITSEGSGGALTPTATGTAADGTSGIIVDGQDPFANASSLYFTSQASGTCTTSGTASPSNTGIGSLSPAICAYKLTQSGLQ